MLAFIVKLLVFVAICVGCIVLGLSKREGPDY